MSSKSFKSSINCKYSRNSGYLVLFNEEWISCEIQILSKRGTLLFSGKIEEDKYLSIDITKYLIIKHAV